LADEGEDPEEFATFTPIKFKKQSFGGNSTKYTIVIEGAGDDIYELTVLKNIDGTTLFISAKEYDDPLRESSTSIFASLSMIAAVAMVAM